MSDQLLIQAVRESDCNEVAYLIEEDGADVNVVGGNGNSLLHMLVSFENINRKNPKDLGGYTPLHIAAQNDAWKIAKLLVDGKADIDALSDSNSTPLIEAAKHGNKNVIAILLRGGPDAKIVDSNGMTAYFYAKKGGHKDICKHLPQVGYSEWENLQKDRQLDTIPTY
ncbi:hypothetical protein AAMO2058_001093700 [Amorphochlora amoebiformis]